ncbi:MAG: hypothetical protein WA192_16010 [Candidatus Acidiferrales bacterium]
MKKRRFLRNANGKKLGATLSVAEFTGPTDDADELEAIRAYDAAKTSDETPVPYEQVLRKVEHSRK